MKALLSVREINNGKNVIVIKFFWSLEAHLLRGFGYMSIRYLGQD